MIVELNISNFAIIDDLTINFTKGFNVLTGETGAGKSIIIEGIGMLLGERASKDLVRSGKEKASLEGLFFLEEPERINRILDEYGIDIDPNNYLLISREIFANGRSVSRINGRTVTLAMLNKVTSNLVDIHGQHEHQSLLNVDNHIKLIDIFGDNDLKTLLRAIRENYEKLLKEKKKLKELSLDSRERDREIDLLRYQLTEIDEGDLLKYDEEEIFNEYRKLSNIKEIGYTLGEIADIINSRDYNNISVLDGINRCIAKMNNIVNYDDTLKEFGKVLEYINFEIQDLSRNIMAYIDNLEVDGERLEFLEERIDVINKLKRKYGNTIEEILNYRDSIENRLEILMNIEKAIDKINKNIEDIEKKLTKDCEKLTQVRKKISNNIETSITKELKELNMENVVFKVNFQRLEHFTANGWDKVEFLISTNKGEDLKPLSKIVSGGEMSRIMLGFKRILADYDNIGCLIFDEIDTGISGRTAQVVGEKIKAIGSKRQVICISHSPQIAALADTHFLIEKDTSGERVTTRVRKLDYNERIEELSRLLGGVDLTDTTKMHAKEMLEMSKNLSLYNK
ncbi:MAG: DNA repair protein RecN [Tissierellia bacterium]|nr:DNA repair protein RecN [Tissierellia bacterium]